MRRYPATWQTLPASAKSLRNSLQAQPTLAASATVALLIAVAWSCMPFSTFAQDLEDLKKEEKPGQLDILDDLNEGKKQSDLAGMKLSHLSLVETWQPVRPERPAKDDSQKYAWAASRGMVSPLGDQPISTLVQVPEKGKYRVHLRHVLSMLEKRPVTLRIAPAEGDADSAQSHEYGAITLVDGEQGKEQESQLPIRVESQLQLNTIPDREMPVWEYWDVDLARGSYRISLEAK